VPNGRITAARIQIVTDLGATLDIAALSPTEQFAVQDAAEGRP
jgi:hypothetical protein